MGSTSVHKQGKQMMVSLTTGTPVTTVVTHAGTLVAQPLV